MKKLGMIVLFIVSLMSCTHHQADEFSEVVNTSCGICMFEMTGDECELAVQINDKYYYVEGTTIDEHGDAHAEDGFCNAIRKAKVTGKVKNGVFYASSFELLPQ